MLRALSLIVVSACLLLAPGPAARAAPERWQWPIAEPHTIVRPWMAPATRYSAGHRGIDIAAPDGVVVAPTDGTVLFVGVVVDRPVLSIRHADGLVTSYEPVESTLRKGDAVARGAPLGTVVAGHCALRCLHFGVRLDGEYVSPLRYLAAVDRAVLLPTRARHADGRAPLHATRGRERTDQVRSRAAGARRPVDDREARVGLSQRST